MDQHLRLLLRRFAVSKNSEDAAIFANVLLRTDNPGPISVWSFNVEGISSEHQIYEVLCLMQKSAYQAALTWIQEYQKAGSRFTTVGVPQTPNSLIEQLKIAIETNEMSAAGGILEFINIKLNGVNIKVEQKELAE